VWWVINNHLYAANLGLLKNLPVKKCVKIGSPEILQNRGYEFVVSFSFWPTLYMQVANLMSLSAVAVYEQAT